MKNLVIIVCAFTLMLFASCNKPTTKNVTGNWCMTEYKNVESNESSDTTIETSFIDADWQQTTYANGQQEKIEGKIYYIPSLSLDSNGCLTKIVRYYYTSATNDTIYINETITGIWNCKPGGEGKDIKGLDLCFLEKTIRTGKIENGYPMVHSEVRSRYEIGGNYIVYNIDEFDNRKIVLSLDEYVSTQKIESSNIILERITNKNAEKYANRYGINIIGHLDN